MPPRRSTTETGKSKHSDIIDLDLPENHIKRIDNIFDTYFGLGMRKRTDTMEGNSTPIFPTKIASMQSTELGNTLSHYSAWASYTSDKAKYVTVACNYMEQEIQSIVDRALGDQVGDKGNIEAKKAKARASVEYQSMLGYVQKLKGLKTMLDMEVNSLNSSIQSLSREVSRREMNGGF